MILHSKQQNTYQWTLGTEEPTSIGAMTSLGPSMDPTWSFKSLFSHVLQNTFSKPSKHYATQFLAAMSSSRSDVVTQFIRSFVFSCFRVFVCPFFSCVSSSINLNFTNSQTLISSFQNRTDQGSSIPTSRSI